MYVSGLTRVGAIRLCGIENGRILRISKSSPGYLDRLARGLGLEGTQWRKCRESPGGTKREGRCMH